MVLAKCFFKLCFIFFVCLCFILESKGQNSDKGPVADTIIREKISLGADTISSCIGEKVELSCSDQYKAEDILSYKWVNKTTGKIIGRTRTITVNPTITTVYELTISYVEKYAERIVNGDFELGEADAYKISDGGGVSSCREYWLCRSFQSAYTYVGCNGTQILYPEGACKIAKNPRSTHDQFASIKDHSGNGFMLVVNGSPDPTRNTIVWKANITGIIPGKQYAFSAWVASVSWMNPPMLDFSINGKTLGGQYEYYRPKPESQWEQFYKVWTADGTNASISIVNKIDVRAGNDFAIDDISFAPVLEGVGSVEVKVLPRMNMNALKNVEVCEGEDLEVKATLIGGSDIKGYQWWRKSDGEQVGNSEKMIISKAKLLRDSGMYRCIVEGTCGRDTADFSIKVWKKLSVQEKKIDTIAVCLNAPVRLSASKCSGDGLTYSWSKPSGAGNWLPALGNGVDYSKQRAEKRDAGKYMCVVKGTCGLDTIYWVLKVREPLVVKKQAKDTIVCVGQAVNLWVEANDEGGRIRWWSPDGTVIEEDRLLVTAGSAAEIYRFEVGNECAPPAKGSIKVDAFPVVKDLVVSNDVIVCSGQDVVLKGEAKHGIYYAWSGPNGFDAITSEIQITAVTEAKEGGYYLTASDICGNEQKDTVKLSILRDLEGLTINENKAYCLGEQGDTLQVKGGGSGLKYSWQLLPNGIVINKAKLSLGAVDYKNAGHYICWVEGKCGKKMLETEVVLRAKLVVNGNVGLTRVCPDETVTLQATSEQSIVRCEWRKDGELLAETGVQLVFNRVSAAEVGHYECTIFSACESAKLNYQIELKEETMITDYTHDLYVNEHATVRLFVNATGENTYHWTENGVALLSQGNVLIVNDIGVVGERIFVCKVIGNCGEDEQIIRVTIGKYQTLSTDQAVRLCEGGSYSYNAGLVPVGCTGMEAFTYRWERNGGPVVNASLLEFKNLKPTAAGRYTCFISGACGNAVLNLDVVVVKAPELMIFPDTIRLCEATDFQHTGKTVENDSYTFSWQKNGVALGNTTSVLHLKSVAMTDKGVYTCRVTGQCGDDEEHFHLEVLRRLKILDAPDSLLVCNEKSVSMEVIATGDQLEYLWDGPHKSAWQSLNHSTYQNASVVRGQDEGIYSCFIHSTCGNDTVNVVLDIEQDLTVLGTTPNVTDCPNSLVNFFARVNLAQAKYQWTLPDGRKSTQKELLIEGVESTDEGMYSYKITGKCMSVNGEIQLQLHKPLGELVLSEDTVLCEHGTAELRAFCEGANVTYQWRGPGHFTSTDASFVIPSVTKASAGEYNIVVQDVCLRQKTGKVNVALLDDLKKVKIVGDIELCAGEHLNMRAEVEGAALSYQWRYKDQIVGIEKIFQKSPISVADTGIYVCRVTGNCFAKEDSVRLTVDELLKVEESIETVEVCAGVDTSFYVAATGKNVTYLWLRDNQEVGVRSNRLRFHRVSSVDVGTYVCRISSLCGETVERLFHLRMKTRTVIKSHTPDRFVSENDAVAFFVRADGENKIYKWWRDGVALAEQAATLNIPDAGRADTLNYMCVVEGDCGADTVNMLLKIGAFKSLKETQSPDTLCEGSSYTYVADVIPENCYGDETFSHAWFYNGNMIGEESLLKLTELKKEHEGEYICVIENQCGRREIRWNIYIMELPVIHSITPDDFLVEGDKHTIVVEAKGDHLSYTWLKNGEAYKNNTTELSFDPVMIEYQGVYRIVVGNECSSVMEESNLEVWQKTMIVAPLPEEAVMCQKQDTVFRIEALGSSGLLYKWYHNNVLLPSPMIPELRLIDVSLEDAGEYMCVVNGHGGNDTSRMNLVVNRLPIAQIDGLTEICVNDLIQNYSVIGEEQGILYEWKIAGGELTGEKYSEEVDVTWSGTGESNILLKFTSVHTGCYSKEEKVIIYKELPEVYLDIPELVGYCLDSLKLNQGYPYGGIYHVNNLPASSVVLDHKELTYEIVYYYKDLSTNCANNDKQTVGIDQEPELILQDERIETGLCRPVDLVVAKVSEGQLIWEGKGTLNLENLLSPIYSPRLEDGENVYFLAELTDKYGCKANDYEIVSVVKPPVVFAMKDTTVGFCVDVKLAAEYYTSRFNRLDWLPADLLESNGGSSAIVKDKVAGKNVYWMEVTDEYGCKGSDTIVLTVLPPPPIEEKAFCENVPLTVDCQDYFQYAWEDGYSDAVRLLDKSGDFLLTITDPFGCVGTFFFRVHPLPTVNLRDTLLFEGQHVEFVVHPKEGYGPYEIVWQDNSLTDSYWVEKEGLYSVTVSDNLGCMSRDSAFVEVRKRAIAAPDAFLPGSKGENARFYLKEVNFVSSFEMYIYDRWGRLIFKTNEIGFGGGWDGTFKGIDCQPGAYVWVALVEGKEVARGSLVLVK